MSDNNDVAKFGSSLIKKLDDKEKDVKVLSEVDPMLVLRKDILSFFQGIMASVSKKESLKELIESSFIEDLESRELSFQDRISLYKLISTQANISSDSVLSIFKPTPGAPSLLADNLSKDREDDHFDKMYANMKPDDLQKMDKLMKFLQMLPKENKDDV
jgi:hypothetical protein